MFNFKKKKKDAPNLQKSQQKSSPPSSVKHSLLSLEQRLMFDAAAAATASEVASEQVAQEQAEAAVSGDAPHEGADGDQGGGEDVVQALTNFMPAEKCVEVAFVDPTVPNYQEMLAGMDPNIEVIMLDGGQDGIEQMAETLSGRTGIDAIHLISHGSSGELQLGTGTLNVQSMSGEYANELATIRESLSDHADVLVYGCNFAEGSEGTDAVNLLAELTGADVAASSDATGHMNLGGDWEFEVQAGSIETDVALTDTAQMNWAGVLGTETVADTFSAKSYGSNDGTRSWSSNWSEVDVGASEAKGGHIKVNSGELRIETQVVGASVSRGVDLSGARSATLSFDYNNDLDKGGSVEVRISTDGGKTYNTLSDGIFSKANYTGSGTASFDISDYMSADTKIQFLVTGTSGGDRLFIDNVQIDYDVADANAAPTDITLSGSTVAEQAATGTVVGTVSGTDPDAGDTKTYSLTDTAGGRFAIDPTMGVITVADGSALNYEANASHSITVRVTDAGGQSYDKTFTIGVTNVNEGPTDITLTGSTVAENAATGTVVGTAAGVDPDASDTKSYSLTDTAGGRFAIDASTGVITVADGSLLDYEEATSHNITVQITDRAGQSYTERFTINLSNVDEGPTNLTPSEPAVVEPVPTVPEVEVVAGPDPVLDPVDGELEPVVAVDPLMPEPVVEVVVEPDPVLDPVVTVDPVMPEPVVEVVVEPDPVLDPVVTVDPVMPEPVVEVEAGPDPVLDPVDGEPEPVVTVDPLMPESAAEVVAEPESVSEVKVAAGPDGVEPSLVASLLQKSPIGSETVKPFPLPSSIGDDIDRSEAGMTDNLQNPVEWSAQPAPTVDVLGSGRNLSDLAYEGDKNPPAGAKRDGNFSTHSSKQDETIVDPGSANVARPESNQVPWSPIEMDETVSDDSGGLNTPIAIGLIGAVLQGRLGTKEKMTDMRARTRAPYQKSSDEKKSQQPHTDDQEAPPGAA